MEPVSVVLIALGVGILIVIHAALADVSHQTQDYTVTYPEERENEIKIRS